MKVFLFVALALACVMAEEAERVKKDVILGTYPYAAYHPIEKAIIPTAYSAAYPYTYPYGYNYGAYNLGAYPYTHGYNYPFAARIIY